MEYTWKNTHIKHVGYTWEKTHINYMGKNTSSHLFYAHYIRILCVGIPTVGLPTYNMRGIEGGIRGIREKNTYSPRILCVGKYAHIIRGKIYVGYTWVTVPKWLFKALCQRNAQNNCALRIIEGGQICVYYAWENMRILCVGNRPKMALFTRNADVVRWEFPPSSHAYYTWDVGNAHVYYAWDMRGQTFCASWVVSLVF